FLFILDMFLSFSDSLFGRFFWHATFFLFIPNMFLSFLTLFNMKLYKALEAGKKLLHQDNH
ncbi:hypothetical protein ACJX0J_026994, partial [Zea mays]